jgi:hypothetical protein
MASWKEIERIRKDREAVRAIAKRLLTNLPDELNDWEREFLQPKTAARHELTNRQGEKLLEIRDGAESITVVAGFSVRLLIENCYLARLDLSEDDEEFITRMRAKSAATILRRNAGRLMRCARQLLLVDQD